MRDMKQKFWIGILLALAAVTVIEAAPKKQRTVNTARKEKETAQQRINTTNRRLKDNAAQTERSLAELQLIRGEIEQKERAIEATQSQVDSLNSVITAAGDSLTRLDERMQQMRRTYVNALRKFQGSQYATNVLAYIFSSRTFTDAYARLRYLREFAQWRHRRVQEIKRARSDIETQRNKLATLQGERTTLLATLNADQNHLVERRNATDRMVTQLQSDARSLQAALAKEKKRLKSIDNEITTMLQAEERERQRKKQKQSQAAPPKKKKQQPSANPPKKNNPAPSAPSKPTAPLATIDNSDPDAAMSARFSKAKGTMTFPVTSPYRIVADYGASVGKPFNTGIEIVCDGSRVARAVYEGTVSRIFKNKNDGNYAVMLRHGAYISVYYNLSAVSVKANAKVTAGQQIGTVGDDARLGKPMLHFEIRKGSETLNPRLWLRR